MAACAGPAATRPLRWPLAPQGCRPAVNPPADALSDALPDHLRLALEARYWAPIGEAAALERFIRDPRLHEAPERHPALFSDHGVVHVRDVAAVAADLAQRLQGRWLPERTAAAQRRVRGMAILLTYFHDIGMAEPTPAARKLHPQLAAQTVLDAGFDDLADDLWRCDAAGLRSALHRLQASVPLSTPLPWVAREVMALSLCHSKSAVPAAWLDDRPRLRRLMRYACLTALPAQQGRSLVTQVEASEPHGAHADAPSAAAARYARGGFEPFAWLVHPHPAVMDFVDEVIDAVRVLRVADALRQRGTTLRTSAGYELCTDHETGQAVVGLRTADQRRALLLRLHNPITAAEANIRATAITDDGALAFEFYRGRFAAPGARAQLLDVTADVIADIEADALGSFAASCGRAPVRLSAPPDDPGFADELARRLALRHPAIGARLQVLRPPPSAGEPLEPAWMAGARPVRPGNDAEALFDLLGSHGLQVSALDRDAALRGTRRVRVAAGTVLMEAGAPARHVIVPLGPGLQLLPAGGYARQALPAGIPLGVTGVVRGGERNAGIVAQQAMEVLVIDAAHYLADWFRPYDLAGLQALLLSPSERAALISAKVDR